MMLALAYILPYFAGMVPEIGKALCPMHIPVLLTGFICGLPYGLAVGFIAPLLRSVTTSVPPLFPKAVCMAFELATYGAVAGVFYRILPKKKPFVYATLLISMLSGRAVWGICRFICSKITTDFFGINMFIAYGFTDSILGIILQIILVPILIIALENSGLMKGLNKRIK